MSNSVASFIPSLADAASWCWPGSGSPTPAADRGSDSGRGRQWSKMSSDLRTFPFSGDSISESFHVRVSQLQITIQRFAHTDPCSHMDHIIDSLLICHLGPTRSHRENHHDFSAEVSMLSGDFLDQASELLSFVRASTAAFGGLQVVLCGDFMQLPPVQANNLAFQSQVWERPLGWAGEKWPDGSK